MAITEDEFLAANRRGEALKILYPTVSSVSYDHRISWEIITLSNDLELSFSTRLAQGLENARPAELADAEISPSGLGAYFPKIDADIYIPSRLGGFMGSRKWIAELEKPSKVNRL